MFGRYGFDGVSMLQVAQRTGITKAALYWHFDSKEALFLDCQRHLHALFNHHVLDRMTAEDDLGEQLLQMFHGVIHLLRDPEIRGGVAGYWLGSNALNTDAAIRAHRAFDEAALAVLARCMQQARDAGVLKTTTETDDMARATLAVWEGIVVPLRVEPPAVIERLILTLGQAFFRGHGAPQMALALADRIRAGED